MIFYNNKNHFTSEAVLRDYEDVIQIANKLTLSINESSKWHWYDWTQNWLSGKTPSQFEQKLAEKLYDISQKLPNLTERSNYSDEPDRFRAKIAAHACSLGRVVPKDFQTNEKKYSTIASRLGLGTEIPSVKENIEITKAMALNQVKIVDLLMNYLELLSSHGIFALTDYYQKVFRPPRDPIYEKMLKFIDQNTEKSMDFTELNIEKANLIKSIEEFQTALETQEKAFLAEYDKVLKHTESSTDNEKANRIFFIRKKNSEWYKSYLDSQDN